MKYRLETLIHKPRIEVWKFFTDLQKTKLWQPSLVKIESIRGSSGQPSSESKWFYKEQEELCGSIAA